MSTASRPSRHFTPRRGWINDPVSLQFHDGAYHLFFQALPSHTTWDSTCSWGHAVSQDLVTWEERAPILAPGDGDDGCWSGCLVAHDGTATIFYTSVQQADLGRGAIRAAHPADESWNRWHKGETVVEGPPRLPGRTVNSFRDACVLRDGGCWRMVVGAGFSDGTAAALSYVSPDLVDWHFEGVMAQRHVSETEPEWTGSVWECPQLFQLDGVWFLVVSVLHERNLSHVAYAAGDLADGAFTARTWHRLTVGDAHYAACTFVDADDNRGLVFWLRGVGSPEQGWVGAISIPYLVHRDGDSLVLTAHPLAQVPGSPGGLSPDGPIVEVLAAEGLTAVVRHESVSAFDHI